MIDVIQDLVWVLSPVLRASLVFVIGAFTRVIIIRNFWGDPWSHTATAAFLTLCFIVAGILTVMWWVQL